MAKRYHPDVRGGEAVAVGQHDPDVEKFRNVLEAYQVLSVKESRANFDMSIRKDPASYKPMSDDQFNMVHRRDLRNETGNITRQGPARGSYAE